MSSSDEDSDSSYDYTLDFGALDISNDQYYRTVARAPNQPKVHEEELNIPKYLSSTIVHSLPAYNLSRDLFPTYLSEEKFRNFHRPKLRHYNTGPQALKRRRRLKPFPVKNLTRHIYKRQKKLRNRVIQAINKGSSREEISKTLLIREARELTVKHGELFLFEYTEEYPPVLSQVGMASNVKNYRYRATSAQMSVKASATKKSSTSTAAKSNPLPVGTGLNASANQLKSSHKIGYDEVVSDQNFKNKPLYYNQPTPGTEMQMIENNLYRAPIFAQEIPSTDFLIIRTRQSFYIRSIKNIFTVGQTMPLQTIPAPGEREISKFRADLSSAWIHKLFMSSHTNPPTMELQLLNRYFPDYPKTQLRDKLKRAGVKFESTKHGTIALKAESKFGDLDLKEHRRRFTPETYCLNMAMLAARQRLRELNYSEGMIHPENQSVELETEVLAAPWNTSKAVEEASKKKCFLDFKKHLIDPTGPQREGFSCVQWSKSPTEEQQAKEQQQKKEQQSVNRVKNPTNTVSMKNPLAIKIQREKLERLAIYQREANLIAKVQQDVLSSREILSSDEDEDEGEAMDKGLPDESFDEQLRDLDKMVLDGRTEQELSFEKEEEVRLQMQKDFVQNGKTDLQPNQPSPIKSTSGSSINVSAYKNKVLIITRIMKEDDGHEHRLEIIREPKVIALYDHFWREKRKKEAEEKSLSDSDRDQNTENMNITSTSDAFSSFSQPTRMDSSVLQPSELCRTEGLRLRISKKVLDPSTMRKMRNERRAQLRFTQDIQPIEVD